MKRKNNSHNLLKKKLLLVIIGFLLSCSIIIATTPLHEAAHWLMSDIDPYIEPVELCLFDSSSLEDNHHILFSPLGFVRVKESYPGALKDRPKWADLLQEIICISIQIIIAIIVVLKTLPLLIEIDPSALKK